MLYLSTLSPSRVGGIVLPYTFGASATRHAGRTSVINERAAGIYDVSASSGAPPQLYQP